MLEPFIVVYLISLIVSDISFTKLRFRLFKLQLIGPLYYETSMNLWIYEEEKMN